MKRASAPLPTLVIGRPLEDGVVPPVVGFPGFEPAEGSEGESAVGTPTPVAGGFPVGEGFSVGEGPGDGRTPVGEGRGDGRTPVGLEAGGVATGGLTGTPAPAVGPSGTPAAGHWVRGRVLTLHSPGRANTCVGLMGNPNGVLVPNNRQRQDDVPLATVAKALQHAGATVAVLPPVRKPKHGERLLREFVQPVEPDGVWANTLMPMTSAKIKKIAEMKGLPAMVKEQVPLLR